MEKRAAGLPTDLEQLAFGQTWVHAGGCGSEAGVRSESCPQVPRVILDVPRDFFCSTCPLRLSLTSGSAAVATAASHPPQLHLCSRSCSCRRPLLASRLFMALTTVEGWRPHPSGGHASHIHWRPGPHSRFACKQWLCIPANSGTPSWA